MYQNEEYIQSYKEAKRRKSTIPLTNKKKLKIITSLFKNLWLNLYSLCHWDLLLQNYRDIIHENWFICLGAMVEHKSKQSTKSLTIQYSDI